MADRKSDFVLPTLDDLFSTQEERDDARLEKIRDIPLDLIDDFPDHPFHVRDDEDMLQLVESIKTNGVLTPAVLRQKEDGRYEIVSGHRRKRACEIAGLTTLRSEIKDLTRDEAVVYMVESNFQRTTILPSEKAFAYKMRFEAMKRQGRISLQRLSNSPILTMLSLPVRTRKKCSLNTQSCSTALTAEQPLKSPLTTADLTVLTLRSQS